MLGLGRRRLAARLRDLGTAGEERHQLRLAGDRDGELIGGDVAQGLR